MQLALRVKKWQSHYFEKGDSASAEADIFHCQRKLTAVKNVRNDFGRAEIAPPARQSPAIRL